VSASAFTPVTSGMGLTLNTTYNYALVTVDANRNTSKPGYVEINSGDKTRAFTINLSGITPSGGSTLIYRTGAMDSNYDLVAVVPSSTRSFTDRIPDSQRGPLAFDPGTSPHGDSRARAFIGNPRSGYTLIEADDGGLFQL